MTKTDVELVMDTINGIIIISNNNGIKKESDRKKGSARGSKNEGDAVSVSDGYEKK